MKIYQFSIVFLAIAAFLACRQTAADGSKSSATTAPAAKKAAAESLVFRGTVGAEAATFHLLRTANPSGGAADFFYGTWFLDREERPMDLSGAIDSAGLLRLEFYDRADDGAFLLGKIAADFSAFEGSRTFGKGKKSEPFQLKRAVETPAFGVEIFADSLHADSKIKDSPISYVSQTWLWPKTTDAFLESEIRKGMLGDSLAAATIGGPAASFAAYKIYNLGDYPAEVAEWIKDGNELASSGLMRDNSTQTDVFYAQNGLLTLGFGESSYTGGAHGMHATTVRTFDLAAKKALKITDVFVAGYEKKLSAALESNARKQVGLGPKAPLSDYFFEKSLSLNENFGLTSKGIFFDYAPYEIASYAQGEIQIFVPFDEIKDILKPR